MKTISLRPHHLLCMAFFIGKGYSSDFVENMTKVISTLENENPLVRIVSSEDSICHACPNNLNGKCITEEKVLRYDKSVLDLCGLQDNTALPFNKLKELIDSKILSLNLRCSICNDCEWSDLCH